MPVYISTACLADGHDLFKVLDTYSANGISNVELGSVHSYIPYSQLKRLKQYPFNFLCHNYFPPPEKPLVINLSTQNPKLMKRCKEQLKHSIDFCSEMGIDLFTFHSGFRVDLETDVKYHSKMQIIPYEEAFMTFAEALAEINEYATGKGVRIAVENHVAAEKDLVDGLFPYAILYKAEEFERLWSLVPSANLGMLLDLGHLNVAAHSLNFDKYGFIDRVKDKIWAFHVHDNNGRSDEHGVVIRDSWFVETISQEHFKGRPLILENGRLNPEQIVEQKYLIESIVN